MTSTTDGWTKIERFGSFYTVHDGALLQAPMDSNGGFNPSEACEALTFSNAEDELFVLRTLLGISTDRKSR